MDSGRIDQSVCASSRPAMSLRPRDSTYPSIRAPYRSPTRPIFTADPLAFKRDKKSSAISLFVHVVVVALVLSLALKVHTNIALQPAVIVTPIDFALSIPPMTLPVAKLAGGGGGSGAHELVEPVKAELPTIVRLQTMAPRVIKVDQPKLAIEP
jgi:periplasmic protein TonB